MTPPFHPERRAYRVRGKKRAVVDAFHRVALANGGTSGGEPGLRPEYDANYSATFVRDPDGNRIEALTFVAACTIDRSGTAIDVRHPVPSHRDFRP